MDHLLTSMNNGFARDHFRHDRAPSRPVEPPPLIAVRSIESLAFINNPMVSHTPPPPQPTANSTKQQGFDVGL
ncbi:hypothetical protein BD410DRAFT_636644 [Rickenella mellea]|uniref:Uncharacterized protein n=1 Tax=Rickenella mellea TaxID=50990 RepID=A0A4Y7QEQ3_9AGAM|nr:hypothetical protein BD410DRAFT_636644 [Rickenella mellea]